MLKGAMRRLRRLEEIGGKKQPRVVLRFHLNDGRVVDSTMKEISATDEGTTKDCIFFDLCESDLYV
jgi:hypothetical protein